jgi:hypothetical protein
MSWPTPAGRFSLPKSAASNYPPFPRGNETEFSYAMGGAKIDATPSPRFFTIGRRKTNRPFGTKMYIENPPD